MAKLIDGKAIREQELDRLGRRVSELKSEGISPSLAVIIVGSDHASRIYVNNKKAACERTGIISIEHALPEETTTAELLELIDSLNADPAVSGILCQNVGRLSIGSGRLVPCTPMGMVTMLEHEGVDIAGKHCVIIGRSNIVGKPMAMLMLAHNATVTVCHSQTRDLPSLTKQGDILVAAVGKAKFVTADMVKEGAVVLDVGMNRGGNGKLCGDVDFEAVKEKASLITPVPGGVGPMTIAMLMRNTVEAAAMQAGKDE